MYLNHPLMQEEEFHVRLPIKDAAVDGLRLHVSQTRMFREHGWQPDEMGFFGLYFADCICLPRCGDDLLDDFRALRLFLTPVHPDSDEDMATHMCRDESDLEDEDAAGPPTPVGTPPRRVSPNADGLGNSHEQAPAATAFATWPVNEMASHEAT